MNIQTRQTSEGIASALYRQQVEEADRICDEFAQSFWPMIGTANQCAYLAMDEAVDAMIEAGMMRHQVKVKAMKALQEFDRYDKAVRKHFNDFADDRYYLWADMTSRAALMLQPDVQKLYFAIKNVLDAHSVRNSEVYAKIQTACALITLAVLMYDTMAEQFQRRTPIRIAETFRGGRLTNCERLWLAVADITGRKVLQHVDLRNDEACQLGVRVILTKYQRAEFLNDAAGVALDLNPEIKRLVDEHRI